MGRPEKRAYRIPCAIWENAPAMWSDPQLAAAYSAMSFTAFHQFSQDGVLELDEAGFKRLTFSKRMKSARICAEKLENIGAISVEFSDNCIRITVLNYAKTHGFEPNNPVHERERERERERDRDTTPLKDPPKKRARPKTTSAPPPVWAFTLAGQLRDCVVAAFPSTKITAPQLGKSAGEFAKITGSTPDELRIAIIWLWGPQRDHPYAVEARSGATFRKKWEDGTIPAAMERHKRSSGVSGNGRPKGRETKMDRIKRHMTDYLESTEGGGGP